MEEEEYEMEMNEHIINKEVNATSYFNSLSFIFKKEKVAKK